MHNFIFCLTLAGLVFLVGNEATSAVPQIPIARVEKMPNLPQPLLMRDWRATALAFDRYAFDFNAQGEHLPLIWLDEGKRNFPETTFGLYTAMGDVREGPRVNHGENHEAIAALGAVLGASLVGIDKTQQNGHDFVRMLRNYFNRDNGWNIVMNFTHPGAHIGGGYGNDYWYDVYNNLLFYAVASFYPHASEYPQLLHTIAEQFYRSARVLDGDYAYSFFDFKLMEPGRNQIPTQEDVAAGYAYILYSAYARFGEVKYLAAAQQAMDALSSQTESRFYEALMPFAAYIGARMNAELGARYDLTRFLDWTFDGTATNRDGWGVIVDKWGGYDVSGLCGSTKDLGGYAFAMNTFGLAWPLTALVRYDTRYARAVGKWLLNAANAARLFYPDELPESLQAAPQKKALTRNVIAYEGLAKTSRDAALLGRSPVAMGDGPLWAQGMPPESMFSLYGSGHAGIFGGVIQRTNVEGILQIDTLRTDFYRRGEAYPTYLFYNPHPTAKTVKLDVGPEPVSVYDGVGQLVLKGAASSETEILVPADSARVLVLVPSGLAFRVGGGRVMAGQVVVDYRHD